MTAQSKGENI